MNTQSQPDSRPHFSPAARNPKTEARFRNDSWWQITFPVLAVTVLLFGCVVGLFLLSGIPGVSIVADYSVILLSFPIIVIGLIGLALIAALTYLIMILLQRIPPYAFVAHQYFDRVHGTVTGLMNKITGAMIGFMSLMSGISLFLKQYSSAHDNASERSTGPTEPGAGLD